MESEIYPVNEYIDQAVKYLTKRHNITPEQAKDFVLKEIKANGHNPTVSYYYKQDNGDRSERKIKLTKYITEALNDKDIIVPSFTTYYNNSKQKSIHSEFMASNTKKRSVYKKAAFKAKQDGDIDTFNNMNSMQKATKVLNNSLSGVYGSKSTILYNPSAHYTLTSTTRCISSIGNSVTESFIYGNKHFKSPAIVYNYITTILTNINMDHVRQCITKYKLHIPTVEEIVESIHSSSKWYWQDDKTMQDIQDYISKLTEEERVAVLYTNDIWHMKMYNEDLIRNTLTTLTNEHVDTSITDSVMEAIPETLQILAKCILANEVKGKNINYKELVGTELGARLFGTSVHLKKEFDKIELLFTTFFCTNVLPPTIAYIKEQFRQGIVLSDTDSTCCSYDKWVEWYGTSKSGISIAQCMTTMLTKCVESALYRLSTNMNIDPSLRTVLAMKNEFYWPVFISSNTNKHYFASVLIQEGNVFKEEELEIKGVHFIASNANQAIVKEVKQMMRDVLAKLGKGEDVSAIEYMLRVKELEQNIIQDVQQGSTKYFKQNNIKDATAYAGGEFGSPYLHYVMWTTVFEPKYGVSDKPPYMGVKIPVMLENKVAIDNWLKNMPDQELADRLNVFFTTYKKTAFNTFMLPAAIVNSKGLPTELVPIVNTRRIILDNLKSAYLVLETLSVYLREDEIVSDII